MSSGEHLSDTHTLCSRSMAGCWTGGPDVTLDWMADKEGDVCLCPAAALRDARGGVGESMDCLRLERREKGEAEGVAGMASIAIAEEEARRLDEEGPASSSSDKEKKADMTGSAGKWMRGISQRVREKKFVLVRAKVTLSLLCLVRLSPGFPLDASVASVSPSRGRESS